MNENLRQIDLLLGIVRVARHVGVVFAEAGSDGELVVGRGRKGWGTEGNEQRVRGTLVENVCKKTGRETTDEGRGKKSSGRDEDEYGRVVLFE
jgi:hypothetical protein